LVTKTLSVLFVASEVEGLIKSGGLADVAKALPKALQTLEQDVRVTIPAYRNIPNIDFSRSHLGYRAGSLASHSLSS
jgi:starch synthase